MTDGRRILGTFAAMTPQLLQLTKGNLNNSYIWNQIDPSNDGKEWKDMVEAYKKDNNGETPGVPPVAFYFDSVYAVKDAIETLGITGDPAKLKEERQKIAEYLYNSKEFKGIQGNYKWEKGKKLGTIHLFQVRDNKYQKINLN